MTTFFLVLAFGALFLGLVWLLQAAIGREPDPFGANAALGFLDPKHRGPEHPPERHRGALALRGLGCLVLAAGFVALAAVLE